jgi:hypothetical protein
VTSVNGRRIPIVALFPLESMRTDAAQAVDSIAEALPILEDFMKTPHPVNVIHIWYGFVVGSFGGGDISTEDRATYEARISGQGAMPFEAILDHELSHTYIKHESMDQFLELYAYNLVHTSSPDLQSWVFTRGYVAWRRSNEGIYALLDVYQLIGRNAMSNAYNVVYALRPPYGQPLSSECKQAFIDEAPEASKTQVADKMAKVTN